MASITLSVGETELEISFGVQKRIDNSKTVKDTICYGAIEVLLEDVECRVTNVLVPAIAYQSIKDNYDKVKGQRLALDRFIRRNSLPHPLRPSIWKAFGAMHEIDISSKAENVKQC